MSTTTRTGSLLACGVAAGPVYVVTALIQALTRPGFDLARHDVSLLANGPLGFVQIANFLVTGLLTVLCAIGLRRRLTGRGRVWGPRLVAVYGLGLIGAGICVADPADGFPLGTAPGHPATISWHGLGHIVFAGLGFFGLIAACFVFASRFAREGRRGRAWYSRVSGILFLAGFAGVASGSGSPAVVLGFWAAVVVAWTWLAVTARYFA